LSFILQTQREAIEDLIRDWPTADLRGRKLKDIEFCVLEYGDGAPRIYCWGVSGGYGSCSRIHGMNVAVFGKSEPESDEVFDDFEKLQTCYYAVLVSEPFEEDGQIKRRVDLLKHDCSVPTVNGLMVFFRRTGEDQEYVQLI